MPERIPDYEFFGKAEDRERAIRERLAKVQAELAEAQEALNEAAEDAAQFQYELGQAQEALREIATLENIGAVRAARRTVGAGTLSNRLDVLLNQLRRARPDEGVPMPDPHWAVVDAERIRRLEADLAKAQEALREIGYPSKYDPGLYLKGKVAQGIARAALPEEGEPRCSVCGRGLRGRHVCRPDEEPTEDQVLAESWRQHDRRGT
jgi:hypothetical protein